MVLKQISVMWFLMDNIWLFWSMRLLLCSPCKHCVLIILCIVEHRLKWSIHHTRAPYPVAMFYRQTLTDRCMLSSLWWMGKWFITLQDNLCRPFCYNKGRLAVAGRCERNGKYRPLLEFHQNGEATCRGKILDLLREILFYKTSLHFSFRCLEVFPLELVDKMDTH